MSILGLAAAVRGKVKHTTLAARDGRPDTRPDLLKRDFTVTAPNQRWVADNPQALRAVRYPLRAHVDRF